jgi:hypothetical protein
MLAIVQAASDAKEEARGALQFAELNIDLKVNGGTRKSPLKLIDASMASVEAQ